jgi:hypothetical protein
MEGGMRARLVTLLMCATVLLVLPAQANEKPTPDYQKTMKELGTVNNRLRNNLKNIDFAAIEKDAVAMKALFETVVAFWQERKVEDAIKLAQDGAKAAADLEMAAKAQSHPGVVAAQAAIAGASSTGEIGAIGVCAPCHTAHRVRLPDGTYEIK